MEVKGCSKLFDLIENLPLTAPVDIMHQVYLGVGKVLLQVLVARTVKKYMEIFISMVANLEICFFSNYQNRSMKLYFFQLPNELKRNVHI